MIVKQGKDYDDHKGSCHSYRLFHGEVRIRAVDAYNTEDHQTKDHDEQYEIVVLKSVALQHIDQSDRVP